jgi:predicted small lipoprotein YifL
MRFLLICGALALVAGCGQKGPLFLSDKPPAGTKLQKAPPYKPVPYPKDTDDQDQK